MMHDNCQEYDCSTEPLLLHSDKQFQFCSNDTHIRFLLIYLNNRQVNIHRTFQIIGLFLSYLVSVILMLFVVTNWLTQIVVDGN